MRKIFAVFYLSLFGLLAFTSSAQADTTISTNITSNQTWTTASGTYIVTTGIAINSGITLTINSGVVVKFQGTSAAITVNGTLNAQGSTSSPIYFTSYKDDTIGGDTNGDGSASTPYNGDWRYLYTPTGGATTLTHAIIRYGGASGEGQLLVYNGGTATLTQSEVASSSSYGVANLNTGGTITINYSDLHDNGATTSTTYFGVRHLGGTTTIDHSTIRNNANYGIQCDIGASGGNLYVTNNTFTNSRGGAAFIWLGINLNFVHYNNVSAGGGKGGIVIYGSPSSSNKTWYGDPYLPYIINSATGSVTFTGASTVTVGAGAVFKLEGAGAKIDVNYFSTLNADSSASTSKIYFTSIKDDTVGGDTNGDGSATTPSAGDWDTFKVTGVSTLNNVVVRYGGNNVTGSSKMAWIDGGTLNLNNVEIASSSVYGLYDGSYWSTLNATSTTIHHNLYGYTYSGGTNSRIANRGNTIYANSLYGIVNLTTTSLNAEQIYWPATSTGATMNGPYSTTTNPNGHGDAVLPTYIDFEPWVSTVSGNITTNTTWNASSTYVVDGVLTVDSGKTLNVASGTIVKFKTPTSGIVVNGVLIANSAASGYKDYFTSYKDDAVGGDTNGDGSATTPSAGDWDGIKINAGAFASTSYAVVRYGGYTGSGGSSKMLWNSGTLTMQNSEIASSSSYGIYHDYPSTALYVIGSDIHHNNYGFFIDDSTSVNIYSNNIHDNSSYGLHDDTIVGIDVTYNYWGASNGPSGDGPGSGDQIETSLFSDYTPWLDKVHYLSFYNENLVTSVTGGVIDWNWYNATSTYKDAWYAGVKTWNTYGNSVGGATIATSTTATSSSDLLVLDIASSSSDYFVGVFFPVNGAPDLLKFNPYYMDKEDSTRKQNVTTHELGHAFGLFHSYLNNTGNIMNPYVTSTTTLGVQDKLDYDYCWVSISCAL